MRLKSNVTNLPGYVELNERHVHYNVSHMYAYISAQYCCTIDGEKSPMLLNFSYLKHIFIVASVVTTLNANIIRTASKLDGKVTIIPMSIVRARAGNRYYYKILYIALI